MTIEQLKKQLQNVIERYSNRTEFTGEVRRDVMARDCLSAIKELEAENNRLKAQLHKPFCGTKHLN